MQNSRADWLREALRRSHAAIAMIVLLYLWAISPFVVAFAQAWDRLGPYVATAIAIRGAPTMGTGDWSMLHISLWLIGSDILAGIVEVILAWLVARQVYGTGPLQALSAWGEPFLRRSHA